jgi:preprotein translocase subunit SecA
MIRIDNQDLIFRTIEEKVEAIIGDISTRNKNRQPILVGTTSIESSEHLSDCLQKAGLEHQVLNAKQHEKEAEIIAQAGRPGMITIATNMAGRGTDIVLGGNYEPSITKIKLDAKQNQIESKKQISQIENEWKLLHDEVIKSGGLHIIGTERHESRRIDNQLRGRSGRQGDPGSSRFYLAMDDPLLRIFAGEKMKAIMDRLGVPKGEAIEAGMVTRSIESAQRKVEGRNFDIRKQLLEYDNVSNEQRKILYAQRNEILESDSVTPLVSRLREGALESNFRSHIPEDSIEEQWDLKKLDEIILKEFSFESDLTNEIEKLDELDDVKLLKLVFSKAEKKYFAKTKVVGENLFNSFERSVLLQTIDLGWREHLSALDHLRQGIHLRGYAQKDPKQEYKKEAFSLFERYLGKVRDDVTKTLMTIQIDSSDAVENEIDEHQQYKIENQNLKYSKNALSESIEQPIKNNETRNHNDKSDINKESATYRRDFPKVGRNDICPCGSDKKYKHCHGKIS